MFFPKAMSELELIVPSKDLLEVMRVLSGHGVFHQSEGAAAGLETEAGTANAWQEKAASYAALERRILSVRQVLGIEDTAPSSMDFEDVANVEAVSAQLQQIELEVKETSDRLAESRKEVEALASTRRQLEPVSGIDLNMGDLRSSHYLYSILGVMPAENVGRMQTSLARVPHLFLILREDPKRPVVWLAGTQSNKDVIGRAASSAYVEALTMPGEFKGSPSEIIQSLELKSANLSREVLALQQRLEELASAHRAELLRLGWEVHASRTLTEAIARFGRLRHTYIVVGWTPTDDLEVLTRRLRQVSREIIIETIPTGRAGDKRNVPVALQNSRILRPFQMLVTTYARPRYGEIDPTWLIALTFPVLFGAMFGDVGHGLLLAALGLLVSSRKVRVLQSLAGLGGLITICGLLAAVFGVLYGSVFGYEDILPAVWLQPSHDPLRILAMAIGAGVVLLTLGFLLGIFNSAVSGDWGHLLFGHNGIAGFVLYWSILGLVGTTTGLLHIKPNLLVGTLIVSGLAVMFSEILVNAVDGVHPLIEAGVGTYAIQAPMELFEAFLSFVSNSLSYVRVGAFAIAHVVLSSVVFLLAGLIGPGHGASYWIVLAIGTIGIVLYEGLIVGIQAMRLSYYEFFSKFFSGGGMRFEPLTLTPTQDS